ncbi:MAG: glucose 1-dehydrogenase [Syntrophaceae bacterium]|jgi:2-deoxy-D-gluconate 3-dehydrogenase|nr:glucose 1-dehydrogenase [Syntrophaceae bacterium]
MKDLFNLKGKVAIVTGGNGGIGLGIARGFASVGADVVIAARNMAKSARASEGIRKDFGVKVLEVEVDVRQERQIEAMVKKVLDTFGRIDILVNNAGMNIRKFPQDLLQAEYDEVLEVNLRSAFLTSKHVYPAMKKVGGGKIINIGSMTSIFGGGKLMAYGTSKGGIVAMTRAMAVAWATDNIQVNAILPGWIDTELTRKARVELEGLNERVLARTPMGRWGTPEDLAGTAIYLVTAASNFITGVALPVDGGYSVSI